MPTVAIAIDLPRIDPQAIAAIREQPDALAVVAPTLFSAMPKSQLQFREQPLPRRRDSVPAIERGTHEAFAAEQRHKDKLRAKEGEPAGTQGEQ